MGEVWLTDAQAAQAKIELRPLARENVDDTVVTAGRFTFDDARVAHVYSPVNGRVTNIAAALGQRVKPRGPLATIDSPEIGQFSSDVNKAQADLVAAEHDYNRKRDLFANHACSQFDYEQAEDNYRKAQSELDRARQKMLLLHGASGGGVDQRYLVTSPIEGEIIARNISPGIEVQGQYSGSSPVELFTVGELDRVWMLADVYEMDVARVKLDAKVQVSVVAYPGRQFEGKLDWISGTLDKDTRTIKVRCTFENVDRALKPEMYATATISVEARKALALSRSSVVRMGDQSIVFVQSGKTVDGRLRFERKPVAVDDREDATWLPVEHGITEGELVVSAGAMALSSRM